MFIYQYECEKCGNKFDFRVGMAEGDDQAKCPKCGAKRTRKIPHPFDTYSLNETCDGKAGG